MAPPTRSDLTIHKAAFEVRYADALALWDRAGQLWQAVRAEWPSIHNIHADPARTVFHWERRCELSVRMNRANIIHYRLGKHHDEFFEFVEKFPGYVAEALMLSEYSRVGLRIEYHKVCPDKETATSAVLATNRLALPGESLMDGTGTITEPEFTYRNEGAKLGYAVRVKAFSQTVEFEPALEIQEIPPLHIEKHLFLVDIDYYIHATTPVRQFKGKIWSSTAFRLINRDLDKILQG